jgi:glycosidase
MAQDTPHNLSGLVIYEVYVRNHGPNGTFADVESDLDRIRSMGVDVVWFMPIHPIGNVARKGALGSPYSISDYRGINPEYGTRADFARLIQKAHATGLKVWLDVVYNHTSHDSVLVNEHPEWFHQDETGRPVTTVPAWSDVIDLKHPNPELSDYLLNTLKEWVRFGVDGFRCDVASIIPVEFWQRARREIAEINRDVVWLAESVHVSFVEGRRLYNLIAHSDSELYTAFDITYDYDIWSTFLASVTGIIPVTRYLEMLRFQNGIYPENFVKMRCVENHDNHRIMYLAPTREQGLAWTAFQAFNRGAFLIYAGQESSANHKPTLFDIDKVNWGNYELQPFLTHLARIKKDSVMTNGKFLILSGEPAIQAAWISPQGNLYGIFNTSGAGGELCVQIPDGSYADEISGETVTVSNGQIGIPETAFILRVSDVLDPKLMESILLDFHIPSE